MRIYLYWVIIASGNGLSPVRQQAITWTNADILSIGPPGANFPEIWIKVPLFSFKEMPLKMSSAKCRPFCSDMHELNSVYIRNWDSNIISSVAWVISSRSRSAEILESPPQLEIDFYILSLLSVIYMPLLGLRILISGSFSRIHSNWYHDQVNYISWSCTQWLGISSVVLV